MGSTRMADQIGRVLGDRYRLLAPIGAGSSGHVFLADDVRLRRRVAVKVLHPALASDEAFLRRFRAEARAAAALNHPHVMAVFDWGEEADGPYLVCEHLGGGSLRAILDRGHRLSPSQALLVGLEAARGLDYAHRRGLVHRDIKPANLLFDDDGRLRIADFGLARALAEAAWTEPLGAVIGTARYASPEQVSGAPLDGKADVYSLAVVLVEAVTGTVPFAADTTVATLMARLERPLEAPPELGPLGPVVARAGRAHPAERLDAAGLGAALQVVALDLPSPGRLPLAGLAARDGAASEVDADPTDVGPRPDGDATAVIDATAVLAAPAPPPPPAGSAGPPPYVEPSKAGRRRRRRWPLALLLLALLGGGGAAGSYVVATRAPSHPLPDVVGRPRADAVAALAALKLEVVVREDFFDGSTPGEVRFQDPPGGGAARLKEGSKVTLVVSRGPRPTPVPDLANLNEEGARRALEGVGHTLGKVTTRNDEVVESGRVVEWASKGESPPKGAKIDVVVSAGPRPRDLPDLSGRTFEQAAAVLRELGLEAVKVEAYTDDDDDKGKVVSSSPRPGSKVNRGAKVTLTVSRGQPVVPNLNDLTADAAAARLEAVDLKVGSRFGPAGGKVFLTTPGSGTKVKPGAAVNLYLI